MSFEPVLHVKLKLVSRGLNHLLEAFLKVYVIYLQILNLNLSNFSLIVCLRRNIE